MERLLAPIPIAVLCAVVALVALLAYGLASNEPDRKVDLRRRGGPARAGARDRPAQAQRRRQGLARRLPRPRRRPQLLGLLVRPMPRRVAPARALAPPPRPQRRHGARRRRPGRGERRPRLRRRSTTSPTRCCATVPATPATSCGILGLPETFVIDRRGPDRRRPARPGRRRVHARARGAAAEGAFVRRTALLVAFAAALAAPGRRHRAELPQDDASATSRTR